MNQNEVLIFVKGEDKTKDVKSIKRDFQKNVVWVTYNNGKTYPYSSVDFSCFYNPIINNITNETVVINGSVNNNVDKVLFFKGKAKIFYHTGRIDVVSTKYVSIIESALDDKGLKNCFDYFKDIAYSVGLKSEDGINILAKHFDSITSVRKDSILADYLSGKIGEIKKPNCDYIFPFGFNLSQKIALENALNNKISIIEGPPGTGKTQTILNIIANAVMMGKSVAVVSSNNSATTNVYDKLAKYNTEFISARLGNNENKELFIKNQLSIPSEIKKWKIEEDDRKELQRKMAISASELNEMLSVKNTISSLSSEIASYEKEYQHYMDTYSLDDTISNKRVFLSIVRSGKILEFIEEYKIRKETRKLNLAEKFKYFIKYGMLDFSIVKNGDETLEDYCQNEFYIRRISELKAKMENLSKKLEQYDFAAKMDEYASDSMRLFKAYLFKKYNETGLRKKYDISDLKSRSEEFVKDYPVVLSTTYSLSSCLTNGYLYDCVIVDEASQVDLATGVLALACAKSAVVVGDMKQLPNVINDATVKVTDELFSKYGLDNGYNYSKHSLLSSIIELFPSEPHTLLREHYRCHPEIIGFCNQRFYNGELIVLTESKNDKDALVVYRTTKGNHARGHINQRQIDVIDNEVIPNEKLDLYNGSVGIVAPYRKQAELLQNRFANTSVKCDTADKFQGQERSVMIFSTVDNEIGDFVSNPNRLNVAVSRAVDQFIVVTDGNDNDSTSAIHDLIGYIQYQNHNIVESQVSSVFDNLYKCNEQVRESILRKYGRINEIESENLMHSLIREVLNQDAFSQFDVAVHVPIRKLFKDLSKLDRRELLFATNHLTHVDFLIYSKVTHLPLLVIEVDGFKYHNNNDKQAERDALKNQVLDKYGIPIIRFNTIGSGEKEKLVKALELRVV